MAAQGDQWSLNQQYSKKAILKYFLHRISLRSSIPKLFAYTSFVIKAALIAITYLYACSASQAAPQAIAPSNLSYSIPQPFTQGLVIDPLVPTITGNVKKWSVAPNLPRGLKISTTTGVIAGTPKVASPLRTYRIKAANSSGRTTFKLPIRVLRAPPPSNLTYPAVPSLVKGVAISPISPTVSGFVTSYSVIPALPAGLAIAKQTGTISGTPTTVTAARAYKVTATGPRGKTSYSLTLSVIAHLLPPSALSYPSPALMTIRRPATTLNPTVNGTVSAYSVSPPLPAGLTLDSSTGAIQGTPTSLSALSGYVITASNSSGTANFTLPLGVFPGPVVHLKASASDSGNLSLTYRWRTTDGRLLAESGTETDWALPSGPGLHFAYLLVSNNSGGYSESRIAVNTDTIGTPLIIPPTSALQAPAGPSRQGNYYRSFVQAGLTSTTYFSSDITSGPTGHLVLAAGVGVTVRTPNFSQTFPSTGPALTNLRGEFVVPELPAASSYNLNCNAGPLLAQPGGCNSNSGWNSVLDRTFSMLPVAITDWYPAGQNTFQVWPWLVGTLKLSDGSACGISDEFFGVRSVGRASYTDANGTPLFNTDPNAGPITVQFGPVDVNEFMDYALPSASLSNGGPTHLTLNCEQASPITIPIPQGLGTGITDMGVSVVQGVAAPEITQLEAWYQGTIVATLPPPSATTQASDVNPRANAFLSTKGIDSRLGACQYYKAVGAVQSCDANGFPQGAVTFDDWKRAVKIGPYALPGTTEYEATYINKMDLNLTRNHHSISYGPGQTAAYVCNHSGPKSLDSTPDEIDQVIADAVAGRNLVACVAMDYSSTPGVNVDSNNVAQPFTRFLIFGPSGELLFSVNLDGRGEKFVPGTCVACHGGDHYAGHYPEDGTGFADIGAHFLPYDTGNFEFSTSPGLTQADQEEAIYQLNQNVLNAGPTLAAQELIAGWYPNGSHILDLNYVPSSWQAGTAEQIKYYKDIESHYCRSCHVALTEGYNFDHLSNYRLPNDSYRSTGTFGFLATKSAQCGPMFFGLPTLEYSMPNSLVTFNRFWALFGDPKSSAAQTLCSQTVGVQ